MSYPETTRARTRGVGIIPKRHVPPCYLPRRDFDAPATLCSQWPFADPRHWFLDVVLTSCNPIHYTRPCLPFLTCFFTIIGLLCECYLTPHPFELHSQSSTHF